jgi:hypothetical protein
LSEKKTYRTWTVAQKLEIVLAGLRGDPVLWGGVPNVGGREVYARGR